MSVVIIAFNSSKFTVVKIFLNTFKSAEGIQKMHVTGMYTYLTLAYYPRFFSS